MGRKVAQVSLREKWSKKYKKSIDCNNPKGFSQKAHCAGRKKRESNMKENCWVGLNKVNGQKVFEIFYENSLGESCGYTFEFDDQPLEEAEYQGRKVKLGKIMQGDQKKFKVYVKNDKGNVVKVNFGQGGDAKGGTMRIRKSNPKARKSFRARHNCDNPGPRWKARYWSCRKW